MKFLVKDIKFDFNTDLPDYYSVSEHDQQLIINDNLGVWEADDEDDLIEEALILVSVLSSIKVPPLKSMP